MIDVNRIRINPLRYQSTPSDFENLIILAFINHRIILVVVFIVFLKTTFKKKDDF